jgi:hypothetical protein
MTAMQDRDLDGLFALAAQRPPQPSAALMDRVLADALAEQPQPVPIAAPAPRGVFARLAALFGGGPMLAGVVSAAVAGVAVGYLNPATLDLLTGGLAAYAETEELFPSADFLTTEG